MELLGILLAAGVATWVYSDARARHASHPALWGIGTFLLLIVVLPAWLLTRPPQPSADADQRRCRYCSTENPPGARFCRNCGRSADDQPPPVQQ